MVSSVTYLQGLPEPEWNSLLSFNYIILKNRDWPIPKQENCSSRSLYFNFTRIWNNFSYYLSWKREKGSFWSLFDIFNKIFIYCALSLHYLQLFFNVPVLVFAHKTYLYTNSVVPVKQSWPNIRGIINSDKQRKYYEGSRQQFVWQTFRQG